MDARPDYRLYHLSELHDALSKIDEAAFPEEAQIIREYIAKGGYVYPREPEVVGVQFRNSAYKWSVAGCVFWLFLENLYALSFKGILLALIPVSVQGAVLLSIATKHKWTMTLVKAWAVLLMVSGVFGGMALYYAQYVEWSDWMEHIGTFAIGVWFFSLADRSIGFVLASSNKPLESTR